MLRYIFIFSIFLFLSACTTVPITGRSQMDFIPQSSMLQMSLQQYDEFLQNNKLSTNINQVQLVKNVGKKIQMAVERYFAQNNMSQQLNGYKWEFNLVDSKEKNAWCMPGGKVVIYTGILPITQDEAGLAVVMGHEIAHAVANHGNERMSHALLTQMGGAALALAVSKQEKKTQQLWLAAFGAGAQFGMILPYSRLHENEADYLGLIFMTMAGYDPYVAVNFWKRMSQDQTGGSAPEFMSTHPSDATRIANIQKSIPEILQKYRQ